MNGKLEKLKENLRAADGLLVAFSGGVEQMRNDEALITQHLGVF